MLKSIRSLSWVRNTSITVFMSTVTLTGRLELGGGEGRFWTTIPPHWGLKKELVFTFSPINRKHVGEISKIIMYIFTCRYWKQQFSWQEFVFRLNIYFNWKIQLYVYLLTGTDYKSAFKLTLIISAKYLLIFYHF